MLATVTDEFRVLVGYGTPIENLCWAIREKNAAERVAYEFEKNPRYVGSPETLVAPLCFAIAWRRPGIVEAILARRPDLEVNAPFDCSGWDIEAELNHGIHPLVSVPEDKSLRTIGTKDNLVYHYLRPLRLAIVRCEACFRLVLRSRRVNITERDVLFAIYTNHGPGTVQLMIAECLARGIRYSIDDDGRTLLHRAAHATVTMFTPILLAMPEQAGTPALDGTTPLHIACAGERSQVVRLLLLLRGINPNARAENGETPLHVAARCNNADALSMLLAHPDIDVNARTHYGRTPLIVAALAHAERTYALLSADPRVDRDVTSDLNETARSFMQLVCASPLPASGSEMLALHEIE